MWKRNFFLSGPVPLVLCFALPAYANTAPPLSGLPELLAAGLLVPGMLVGALVLTFQPAAAPSTKAGRWAALALASAGVVLLAWLTFRLAGQEWRPESIRDYWTGCVFLAPLALAVSSWWVVFCSVSGSRSRTDLRRAWLVPPLCWLGLELVLFVVGTLPAHLS